jgi:predicted porin
MSRKRRGYLKQEPRAIVEVTLTAVPKEALVASAFSASAGFRDKILQVFWFGARYSVTETVDVVGAYYHYNQNDYTTENCAVETAHSQCAGKMDAVSALIDWKFAPKWDTYIGSSSRR